MSGGGCREICHVDGRVDWVLWSDVSSGVWSGVLTVF